MRIEVPKFKTQEEKFDWLAENVEDHIEAKKSSFKKADALVDLPMMELENEHDISLKSEGGGSFKTDSDPNSLKVKVIINTTKIMDSHRDVHIDGLWAKSLKENKRIKHLQEHVNKFDHVIADKDDLKAYTEKFTWKQLGYDAEGETQALVFESNVKRSRNEYMHGQYKEGNVDNHSVGMNYVKIYFAMNSDKEDHAAFKDAWDKYYPMIVNKVEADRHGYFYAVTEAKAREGSAVLDGSNPITPTITTSKDEPITQPPAPDEMSTEMRKWLGL